MVVAFTKVDRAMRVVFGRDMDLLGDVAEFVNTNAERENLSLDFLEDRVQTMLRVFYMRLSSAREEGGGRHEPGGYVAGHVGRYQDRVPAHRGVRNGIPVGARGDGGQTRRGPKEEGGTTGLIPVASSEK